MDIICRGDICGGVCTSLPIGLLVTFSLGRNDGVYIVKLGVLLRNCGRSRHGYKCNTCLWLNLRQISFPLWRGTKRLGPGRPVRAFLAGPLEYKGHSEVTWKVDGRGSSEHLVLPYWHL